MANYRASESVCALTNGEVRFDFEDAELNRASEAIYLPRVQELVRELSEYNLGVCLPHMHSETGQFQRMPRELVAVESGLVIEFRSRDGVSTDPGSAMPVGWVWEEGFGVLAQQYCIRYGVKHVSQ